MVLAEHLDALCPELRAVVDDSGIAGNPPAESWRGFGQAVRLQSLTPVLVAIPPEIHRRLYYVPIGDPHYWRGEIRCRVHAEWFVAVPFDSADPWGPLPDSLAQLPIATG